MRFSSDEPAKVQGPSLLCVGNDPEIARDLAIKAGALLAPRHAIVLSTWQPAGGHGPLDAVFESWYGVDAELEAAAGRKAELTAGAAWTELSKSGLEVTPIAARDRRRPWQVALDIAEHEHASVVVVCSTDDDDRRPGSLGHQARALAHRTKLPLLVIPADSRTPAEDDPAFFAYDGSDPARSSITAALALLKRRPALVATAWRSILAAAPASLIAMPSGVAAAGAGRFDDDAREAGQQTAAEGAQMLQSGGWFPTTEAIETVSGIWQPLADAAEAADAAVIVTGTRGRSRVSAALLGSTAEGLLRHAGRPVLLVPERGRG